MSEASPTRSRLIALKEERRAMQEGYAFLDEKCLVLAGAMLRELQRHDTQVEALAAAQREASEALRAALACHGLDGLSVYPGFGASSLHVTHTQSTLIGVTLRRAELDVSAETPPAAVFVTAEAELCRAAFVALARVSTALAATVGNLLRLQREYRRTVRRASSLHDVVLPELAHEEASISSQLEELDRDEALWARLSRREV